MSEDLILAGFLVLCGCIVTVVWVYFLWTRINEVDRREENRHWRRNDELRELLERLRSFERAEGYLHTDDQKPHHYKEAK